MWLVYFSCLKISISHPILNDKRIKEEYGVMTEIFARAAKNPLALHVFLRQSLKITSEGDQTVLPDDPRSQTAHLQPNSGADRLRDVLYFHSNCPIHAGQCIGQTVAASSAHQPPVRFTASSICTLKKPIASQFSLHIGTEVPAHAELDLLQRQVLHDPARTAKRTARRR